MPFENMPNTSEKTSKKNFKEAEKETLKQSPKFEDYRKDGEDINGKVEVKIDNPPPFEKESAKEEPKNDANIKDPIESARKINLTK